MPLTYTLVIVFILTLIIHASETLSYSIRFAGVRIGKLAVALSLTGIVVLVARTANLIQAPFTANFIDYANHHPEFDPLPYLRFTLVAASAGTLLAIAVFPTFVQLFTRIISRLEVAGSIPKLLAGVTIGQLKRTKSYIRRPTWSMLVSLRYLGIPKRFILLNIVVTAIYTVGVLASLYAAYLVPEFSTTASQSSGLINGMATILLTIFIDPQLGLITDKALQHPEERGRLGRIYAVLMFSRFFGTLLAQLLLVPAAYWIASIVRLIS
ncbi:lipid II flippase Amj family protein [Paenibacillus dendritiformis]|uniref:lipid II flippase Amj family protein n=1 Tax=Paenibacillus TaxID=44249 RepID=UPI003B8A5BDA